MYEHHTEPVISRHDFLWRMAHHVGMVMPLIGLSLGIGVLGYHFIAGLGWIDALLNASMIASGMGPVGDVPSTPGKIFASLYALYSGLFLIAITGWLISPLLHRLMHKFHAQ